MKHRCPHCYQDMDLDTDFMLEEGMWEAENKGSFPCPCCEEVVHWRSFISIEQEFETDPDLL